MEAGKGLFPADLPALRWERFRADGFASEGSGVLGEKDRPRHLISVRGFGYKFRPDP